MSTRVERPVRRHWSLRSIVIMVVLAVIAGGAYGVWRVTRPAPDPGVVAGLHEKPSLTWSYLLQEGAAVQPEPVGGDRALVVPSTRGAGGLVPVSMIRLANSTELWRLDVETEPDSLLTGGEIPGSDHVFLMESRRSGSSSLSVRNAKDGSVVASRELTDVVSVTAVEGSLFLLGADGLARVDPQTLATIWAVERADAGWQDGDWHVVVRQGYALVAGGVVGAPFSGRVLSAHAVVNGSTPAWQPSDSGSTLIIGDQVVRATYQRDMHVSLSGVAPDGTVTWRTPISGLAHVTGDTLLTVEFPGGNRGTWWMRRDPADGSAIWTSPYETSGDQQLLEVHGRLVVIDPRDPALVVLDRESGRQTMDLSGQGHQTAWFEGADGQLISASAMEPGGRVEQDGSLTSPNGTRLRSIDLDETEPNWTWEIPDPVRIVQCGTHLLAIDADSGRIHGIA